MARHKCNGPLVWVPSSRNGVKSSPTVFFVVRAWGARPGRRWVHPRAAEALAEAGDLLACLAIGHRGSIDLGKEEVLSVAGKTQIDVLGESASLGVEKR